MPKAFVVSSEIQTLILRSSLYNFRGDILETFCSLDVPITDFRNWLSLIETKTGTANPVRRQDKGKNQMFATTIAILIAIATETIIHHFLVQNASGRSTKDKVVSTK